MVQIFMAKYYGITRSPEYLAHYGILGMHWGVRRTPEELGHMKIPKNAMYKNLSSFGKDAKHNVCYIMGGSGSGKSTVARNNRKNANVIHLDAYIDGSGAPKSKEFNTFLKSNGMDHKKVTQFVRTGQWGEVDRFTELIDKFGEQQFKKKRRVICEGVQLMDDTIRPDKSYFKDKPYIVLNTSAIISTFRANQRDSKHFSLMDDIRRTKKQRNLVLQLKRKLNS